MEKLGNVQNKIPCVFETTVVEENATKRPNQSYKVVACSQIRQSAIDSGVLDTSEQSSVASEKLDGTCVCVQDFQGRPWLWARHDRKPNKSADKRFKKFQQVHRAWEFSGREGSEPMFQWNPARDFKEVPPHWAPATMVDVVDGVCQPDDGGHTPGWVPVDVKSRQHCWHLCAVDFMTGLALVLRQTMNQTDLNMSGDCLALDTSAQASNTKRLVVSAVPLAELNNTTLELIGTHVNGNPYKLGSKQCPIHFLVRHGTITFAKPPPVDFDTVQDWFEKTPDGKVEGIVWHCSNGKLFKLHRHHIGLKWPVADSRLDRIPVTIDVDPGKYELDTETDQQTLLTRFGKLDQRTFPSLTEINFTDRGTELP